MTRRLRLLLICAASVLASSGALAASASAASGVTVLGTVTAPATYSIAQLAAMPQTTLTIGPNTYQGVPLLTLVTNASPIYPVPPPNNPIIRVTATVTSDRGGPNDGPVTFGAGEFDARFGNNAALLALTQNGSPISAGPRLVLPRDTSTARFVDSVSQVNLVTRNQVHGAPPAGGVIVHDGAATTTLTAAQLAALPQTTRNVSFLAGASPTNNTEMGPILSDVLGAAGITSGENTYVAAVATDDYVSIVTPAEATVGNRPLMLATSETVTATGAPTTNTPRLVTDGDVRGGRYASNVTDLYVGVGAAAPPSATSGAASAITNTAASLAGTVNPNGLPAAFVFEYGTSLSFGSVSPADDGEGGSPLAASASLTGLAPNTTYYYRTVATSSAGTTTGVVRSFRTTGTAQAPAAITGAATSLTNTGAVLDGQVNPNGQLTAFTFEYGTSTSFGNITPVVGLDDADGLEPVSATLSGLTPDTTYYYRVVATNPTGTTSGAVMSFSTGPGGVPIVVTGTASAITGTSATLAGTVDPHGAATAYVFEYGPTNAFGLLSAIDGAGSANGVQPVSQPISGLSPNTAYRFRIVATNAGGTSTGSVGSFTTGPAT